ncbi:hypothetical protein [Formosa sp. PL04]|nr:hypothetical protein [Formosa sp. PL04]MDW5289761.1 hypothetical protein [Formosa sp. PL04]
MRKNDVKKDTTKTKLEDKRLESFIKDREDQNSALKKILEKLKKNNQ